MSRGHGFSIELLIFTKKSDVPEAFVDAPIALQLAGKHFRDEETVAAADLVTKIIQS